VTIYWAQPLVMKIPIFNGQADMFIFRYYILGLAYCNDDSNFHMVRLTCLDSETMYWAHSLLTMILIFYG
jgi:hypothetical protein